MKKVLFILSFFLISFVSCKDDNCINSEIPACNDVAPTDEECLAIFERWFYDSSTSTCGKVIYSGCSQVGFETKEECEACQCD